MVKRAFEERGHAFLVGVDIVKGSARDNHRQVDGRQFVRLMCANKALERKPVGRLGSVCVFTTAVPIRRFMTTENTTRRLRRRFSQEARAIGCVCDSVA